jgi:hypothetical protein
VFVLFLPRAIQMLDVTYALDRRIVLLRDAVQVCVESCRFVLTGGGCCWEEIHVFVHFVLY